MAPFFAFRILAPDCLVQDREAFRQKKKNFLKANSALFDRYAKGNLATVHRGFLQLTNDDAELSRQCYNMALSSMGITDEVRSGTK